MCDFPSAAWLRSNLTHNDIVDDWVRAISRTIAVACHARQTPVPGAINCQSSRHPAHSGAPLLSVA
jgi:hypothetical protein